MKIKYGVIPIDETEMMVIVQDGGIATCHHNDEYILTEYYQDRITHDMLDDMESISDNLAEGKMYCKDWEDKQEWDEEVVQDMLNWLYISTEEVEFVRCEIKFDADSLRKFIVENN